MPIILAVVTLERRIRNMLFHCSPQVVDDNFVVQQSVSIGFLMDLNAQCAYRFPADFDLFGVGDCYSQFFKDVFKVLDVVAAEKRL